MDSPSREALDRIAESYGFGISASDMDTYQAAAAGLLESWQRVSDLYADEAPAASDRAWSRPEDNPLGAWYVTADISTTSEGPLAGRRVAVKDNISVAGLPMMNGSETVRGFVPAEDATVVTRLLEAGATVAGKSVCEDLCFSGASHTSRSGPVRNPWDVERTTGGSSSGSAALVASGEVDIALGGDQGGSIRIPAAFCGVVGHKPTFGLVPYTGAFPIEQSIDHLGPIAPTAADAAAMLTVLAGADGMDPRQPAGVTGKDYVAELARLDMPLRVGVLTEGFGHANSDPEVDRVVRSAVEQITKTGHVADEVSIPWHLNAPAIWDVISVEGATWQMVQGNGYGMNWKGHYDPALVAHYGRQWREDPSTFSDTVKLVALAGSYAISQTYGSVYAMARNLEDRLTAEYDRALDRYDVLVMPTLPITASVIPPADASVEEVLGRALEMLPNTTPFDVTGHPACSIPAGLSNGLPVGLMIVGKKFDDAGVLRAAHAFESTLGTLPAPGIKEKELTA